MRYFDLLAPFYDHFMPAPDPDLWLEVLRLPAAGPLLDLGGGTGRIGAGLRRLVAPVVVVDVSRRMLGKARCKGGLETVQADAARLPFGDGLFPRAVVADALHHFPDQEAAIRELLRVLAPGGRLVIEEFDRRRLPAKILALTEKALLMGSRFLLPEAICRMLRAGGGQTAIRRGPHGTVWIVADKP